MDVSTLETLAEFICGNDAERFPIYRSGGELTRFFSRAGLDKFKHDGSSRKWWVLDSLKSCSDYEIQLIVNRLANPLEYGGEKTMVSKAFTTLNEILNIEGMAIELDEKARPLIKEIVPTIKINEDEDEEKLEPLEPPDFESLGLEPGIGVILFDRWIDTDICIQHAAYLPAIITMGSLLEGILLGVLQRFPKDVNQAKCAPRDVNEKVKSFAEWTLSQMIDCAHELGWIRLDVKKFSHAVRFFRNFIHPYEQMLNQFDPDHDTCEISWLVVQAAVNDLAEVLQNKKKT